MKFVILMVYKTLKNKDLKCNFPRVKEPKSFYLVDEFCQEFDVQVHPYTIGKPPKKKPRMSKSEVITILVLFHLGGFRNIKDFYLGYVHRRMQAHFAKVV